MNSAVPVGITRSRMLFIALLASAALMGACSGDKGDTGPKGDTGQNGQNGQTGQQGPPGEGLDPVANTKPESCSTCHANVGAQGHQATYQKYVDASKLVMTFTGLTSAPAGATWNVTLNFTIAKNGLPYVDANRLPTMLQKTFTVVQYNSTTKQYLNYKSMTTSGAANVVSNGDGSYTITQTGFTYDPTNVACAAPCFDGAMAYGYVAQDLLDFETYTDTHYQLYDNMSSAALALGTARVTDANKYVSNADLNACIGCHGAPYRKHGYREAVVGNGVAVPTVANEVVPTFAPCKACHYDNRVGSDAVWQQMVDDPLGWATGAAYKPGYAYVANLMNDTHMSHAMEFPYPQSMANCATCHTGPDTAGTKLANVRADKFFWGPTCKSCHPVTDNSPTYPTQAGRAPSLEAMWKEVNQVNIHDGLDLSPTSPANTCTQCHFTGSQFAPPFTAYHSGYNEAIYDASTGTKYSSLYGAKIDSATLTGTCSATSTSGCVLDIVFEPTFTAPGTAGVAATIVPTIGVSFYGYKSKDFLVSRHTADGRTPTAACPGRTGAPGGCVMEKTWGVGSNPLWTQVARSDGKWEIRLDVAAWVPPAKTTGTIPAEIAARTIRKAEINVQPGLTIGGKLVALDAVSQTVDVTTTGTLAFVSGYFQGSPGALVDVKKCNNCHDALGTTFHTADYGGSIVLCRSCHVPTAGGSHLEMQSRSLDSYIHAIHKFQYFDIGDVDFTDPVAARRYAEHVEHKFPNFTSKNCEGCHVDSSFTKGSSSFPLPTYNVPDQIETIPGLETASDPLTHGWYALTTTTTGNGVGVTTAPARNIGTIPAYVTSPSSRACGGCHRAAFINEDDFGGLASFNSHAAMGGYLVDTSKTTTTWTNATAYIYGVIDHIMSMFE